MNSGISARSSGNRGRPGAVAVTDGEASRDVGPLKSPDAFAEHIAPHCPASVHVDREWRASGAIADGPRPGCLEEGTWKQALWPGADSVRAGLCRARGAGMARGGCCQCVSGGLAPYLFGGRSAAPGTRCISSADVRSLARGSTGTADRSRDVGGRMGGYSDIPVLGEEGSGARQVRVGVERHQFLVDLARRHWCPADPSRRLARGDDRPRLD